MNEMKKETERRLMEFCDELTMQQTLRLLNIVESIKKDVLPKSCKRELGWQKYLKQNGNERLPNFKNLKSNDTIHSNSTK